jgi:lipid A 3-O-deacylase
MKKLFLSGLFILLTSSAFAKGLSLLTGVLDYSDEQKSAGFLEGTYSFGEDKAFETFVGKIIPITGALLTDDNASMVYAGYKIDYKIGNLLISPSFTPGYYEEGDGKDLGQNLEFKSQINIGWTYGDKSNVGLSYSHISNADLGDKNPGANNIAFTFYTQY